MKGKTEKGSARRGFLAATTGLAAGFFTGDWWRRVRGVTRWHVPADPRSFPPASGDLEAGYLFTPGEEVTVEKLTALVEDGLLRPSAVSSRPETSYQGREESLVFKDGHLWKLPLSQVEGEAARQATESIQRWMTTVNVRDHGARGDGSVNDAPAIQAAIEAAAAAGGGQIVFPAGTFRCDAPLTGRDGVYLQGAGIGATKLLFTSGAQEALAQAKGYIHFEGSLFPLPGLASEVAEGDVHFNFIRPHGLERTDVFFLWDRRERSYAPDSRGISSDSRSTKGEAFRVAEVTDGLSVRTATPSYDHYGTGTDTDVRIMKLHGVRGGVSGFSMEFPPGRLSPSGSSRIRAGIRVIHGLNFRLSELDLTGSFYAQIMLDRCFETTVDRVRAVDYQQGEVGHGYNYGLLIAMCQRVQVANCHFDTPRHGIATGSAFTWNASIVCREMAFTNCFVGSNGDNNQGEWGFDMHLPAEHWLVSNCQLPNGIHFSGDYGVLTGCTISQDVANLAAVANRGGIGMNFTITDNLIRASRPFEFGLIRLAVRSPYRTGRHSRLIISGNNLQAGAFGTGDPARVISVLVESGSPLLEIPLSIALHDNQIACADQTETPVENVQETYGIWVDPLFLEQVLSEEGGRNPARTFDHLSISGNILQNCGIWAGNGILNLVIEDNTVTRAPTFGIRLHRSNWIWAGKRIRRIKGNLVQECDGNFWLWVPAQTVLLVENNVSLDPRSRRVDPSGHFFRTHNCFDIVGHRDTVAVFKNNLFGTREDNPTLRRFVRTIDLAVLHASGNIIMGMEKIRTYRATDHGWGEPGSGTIWQRSNVGLESGGQSSDFSRENAPRAEYGGGAPRAGQWRRGDIVWNTLPAPGQTPGWICTADGTPGRWTAMARLNS